MPCKICDRLLFEDEAKIGFCRRCIIASRCNCATICAPLLARLKTVFETTKGGKEAVDGAV